MTAPVSGMAVSNCLSSSSSLSDPSVTRSTTSASFMTRSDLSTPIFSTGSSVSRIPAVSVRSILAPDSIISPVTVSRVVPGISVTIARSSPRRALRRLLFPTFGLPTNATLSPFLSSLEVRSSTASFMVRIRCCRRGIISAAPSSSEISSG